MNGGFQVDGAALGTHATTVDGLAQRTRAAAAAGRPLDLGAYGLIGQAFAGSAADAARAGSAVLGELAERIAATAHGVAATREAYWRVELAAADRFRGLLPQAPR